MGWVCLHPRPLTGAILEIQCYSIKEFGLTHRYCFQYPQQRFQASNS